MKGIQKQVLKIGILLIAVVSLMAGAAIPVSADAATAPAMHTLQGKVESVAAPDFTILNGDQSQVIKTDAETRFYIVPSGQVRDEADGRTRKDKIEEKVQGLFKKLKEEKLKDFRLPGNWRNNFGWLEIFDEEARFSDIAVGDRVVVRARMSDNLAKQVIIIKAPVIRSLKGTVAGVTLNSISITPSGGGTPVFLNVNGSTRINLKGMAIIMPGQHATAVYNSANSTALTVNIQAAEPVSESMDTD